MARFKKRPDEKSDNRIVAGIIIGFLAVVIGIIVLAANTEKSPAPAVSDSQLSAEETAYDFGTISMAKGKVTNIYKIKNETAGPIVIKKISTSCMCTQATLLVGDRRVGPFSMVSHAITDDLSSGLNEALAPGQEARVEAVFDPAAHGPAGVGPIARQTYVDTTDGKRLILDFKAQVTP